MPDTGIHHAVGAGRAQTGTHRLTGGITAGIEDAGADRRIPQVMQRRVHVEHDLPELPIPSGRLPGRRHEPRVVVHGLEQRGLEGLAGIQHAERSVAEPAGPVAADMDEGRHQPTGAGAGHDDGGQRRRSTK